MVRGRYLAEPARYPAQVRFYQDLDRYGTMVWRTGGDQGARTLEIRGYRLLPEGITALAHDRGSLRLAEIASTPLDPPTFVAFVNGVARAAMIKRDWSMAADYFSVLLEPPAVSQFSDDARTALARLIAALRGRARADSLSRRGTTER